MTLGATCQGMQPEKQSALDVPFLARSSTTGVVPTTNHWALCGSVEMCTAEGKTHCMCMLAVVCILQLLLLVHALERLHSSIARKFLSCMRLTNVNWYSSYMPKAIPHFVVHSTLSVRDLRNKNKVPMGIMHPKRHFPSITCPGFYFLAKTSLPPVFEPLLARCHSNA